MLQINNLEKAFGKKAIIANFSADFSEGIHHIKGNNGSGKSTLLLLIAGLLSADHGDISLISASAPKEYFDIRKSGAYVPDKPEFYAFMTGREYINFVHFTLSQKPAKNRNTAISAILENFLLTDFMDVRFAEMSLGTKKKLFLSAALSLPAKVILLDEPTLGLDNSAIATLEKYLCQLRQDKIIVYSSHKADFLQQALSSVTHIQEQGVITTHYLNNN